MCIWLILYLISAVIVARIWGFSSSCCRWYWRSIDLFEPVGYRGYIFLLYHLLVVIASCMMLVLLSILLNKSTYSSIDHYSDQRKSASDASCRFVQLTCHPLFIFINWIFFSKIEKEMREVQFQFSCTLNIVGWIQEICLLCNMIKQQKILMSFTLKHVSFHCGIDTRNLLNFISKKIKHNFSSMTTTARWFFSSLNFKITNSFELSEKF